VITLDQSTKYKVQKTNPEMNLKRGGLFYTQKDPFDSLNTLDYASVSFAFTNPLTGRF
jgi:hypothetical protein